MKKTLIALYFIFLCSNAYAEIQTERYAVEMPDGSTTIAYYIPGSKETLEEFLKSVGLSGLRYTEITQFPSSKEDRKFWKRNGSRIVIDSAKKQTELDTRAQKEAEKDAVLAKLKISKEELEKLK